MFLRSVDIRGHCSNVLTVNWSIVNGVSHHRPEVVLVVKFVVSKIMTQGSSMNPIVLTVTFKVGPWIIKKKLTAFPYHWARSLQG